MTTATRPSLLSPRPRIVPCLAWSPHEPGTIRKGRTEKATPVQCNRPSGHDGNHIHSLADFERLAEWTPSEVIR